MKTTLELADDLMSVVTIRAAECGRKVDEIVAELIERELTLLRLGQMDNDSLQVRAKRFVIHADRIVTNPDGIEDSEFFKSLDRIREESRRCCVGESE